MNHKYVAKTDLAAQNDWQISQEVPEALPALKTTFECHYGFLNLHSGYLRHVGHTENDINELGADAETCPPDQRRRRRLEHEDQKWDEEHYMYELSDFHSSL